MLRLVKGGISEGDHKGGPLSIINADCW